MKTESSKTSGPGHIHTAIDVAYVRAAISCGEWDQKDGERMIAELEAKEEKSEAA